MGIFSQAFADISGTSHRLKTREYTQAKRAWTNRIASTQAQQAFRATEDPREQAQLKQSMWGRGLGKSTINEQDTQRLTEGQARRNAALGRNLEYAQQGYELVRARYRAAKRGAWAAGLDSVLGLVGAGGAAYGGGSVSAEQSSMGGAAMGGGMEGAGIGAGIY